MKLSEKNIQALYGDCAPKVDAAKLDTVEVDGPTEMHRFSRSALDERQDAIVKLTTQVPISATTASGHGCGEPMTVISDLRSGTSWTTDAAILERFCCLAVAANCADFIGDKTMWFSSWRGVPRVIFNSAGTWIEDEVEKEVEPA